MDFNIRTCIVHICSTPGINNLSVTIIGRKCYVSRKLLNNQFKSVHDWLEGMVGEANNDQLHWSPEGLPSPIGSQYLHTVTVEDYVVHALQRSEPLMASTFAGKTGASELPQPGDWREWGEAVQVDLAQAREYAQAVYAATNAYIDSLSDEALFVEHNLTSAGLGEKDTIANAMSIILLNTYSHTGEISALKGLQGNKDYPF